MVSFISLLVPESSDFPRACDSRSVRSLSGDLGNGGLPTHQQPVSCNGSSCIVKPLVLDYYESH